MDLQTITEDPHVARRKFLEYRDSVRERHNAEDEEIMRGYKALMKGAQLISIKDVLTEAGIDDEGRPMLAIMRADQQWVWFQRTNKGTGVEFSDAQQRDWGRSRRANSGRNPTYLSYDNVYAEDDRVRGSWDNRLGRWCHKAPVPIVPPSLRPAHHLRNYHILWEPNWELQPPPPDPFLLKRVSHDLYAIVAQWDLSPVELQVLGRRFAQS